MPHAPYRLGWRRQKQCFPAQPCRALGLWLWLPPLLLLLLLLLLRPAVVVAAVVAPAAVVAAQAVVQQLLAFAQEQLVHVQLQLQVELEVALELQVELHVQLELQRLWSPAAAFVPATEAQDQQAHPDDPPGR